MNIFIHIMQLGIMQGPKLSNFHQKNSNENLILGRTKGGSVRQEIGFLEVLPCKINIREKLNVKNKDLTLFAQDSQVTHPIFLKSQATSFINNRLKGYISSKIIEWLTSTSCQ